MVAPHPPRGRGASSATSSAGRRALREAERGVDADGVRRSRVAACATRSRTRPRGVRGLVVGGEGRLEIMVGEGARPQRPRGGELISILRGGRGHGSSGGGLHAPPRPRTDGDPGNLRGHISSRTAARWHGPSRQRPRHARLGRIVAERRPCSRRADPGPRRCLKRGVGRRRFWRRWLRRRAGRSGRADADGYADSPSAAAPSRTVEVRERAEDVARSRLGVVMVAELLVRELYTASTCGRGRQSFRVARVPPRRA